MHVRSVRCKKAVRCRPLGSWELSARRLGIGGAGTGWRLVRNHQREIVGSGSKSSLLHVTSFGRRSDEATYTATAMTRFGHSVHQCWLMRTETPILLNYISRSSSPFPSCLYSYHIEPFRSRVSISKTKPQICRMILFQITVSSRKAGSISFGCQVASSNSFIDTLLEVSPTATAQQIRDAYKK
jgi:hypothetical protein